MALHTHEEWLQMFKNKKGFGAVIIEGQEITAVCAELEKKDEQIAELRKAMCIYAREELGNMNFMLVDEVVDYFLSFNQQA